VIRRVVAVAALALALAPAAAACNAHPSQAQLEGQIMCPVCGTTLDQSDSAAAQQIKGVIARDIASGKSDCAIKDELVANYGEAILAAPRRSGFGLLAWWVPLGGALVGAAALGAAAWRWSKTRDRDVATVPALDPALEQRLDDELRRFDG
jgi:cytochrome c-type biogenesis protein CcmH